MKTRLFLKPHSELPDADVLEVWYGNTFIATVTGADGPGVRIISKYPMEIKKGESIVPFVTEVHIAAES